jgi:signal peptidase I
VTDVRVWTWPWLIATTLSKAVIAVVICLGLWGALPAVVGWQPTTVSSGSMLPRLHVGDVAVSRPVGATPPPVGSVLLFDDPDHPGRLRLHRFVRVDDDGRLVTRGDANANDDSSPVPLSAVRGIGTLRVPWVGLPVVWVRERAWLPLALGVLALTALTAIAAQSRRFGFPESESDEPDDEGRPGAAPESPVAGTAQQLGHEASTTQRPAPMSGAASALAVAALSGLILVPAADAAFSDTTATTSSLAAATYFRCANGVTAAVPYFWYRMDETSSTTTTAADSSGGGRTGVFGQAGKTAGATLACARDSGRAITFNGSSGYLSSPLIDTPVPNTFTVGIWFKTTTTRGGKLIGFGNSRTGVSSTFDRHLYMTNAGKIIFGVQPSTMKTITSPKAYNDGAWHHTVATLSSGGMKLYVDGDLVASDTSVTTGRSITSGYVRIAYDNLDGWNSAPTSRYFAGTLDDAAVYMTALSANQVDAQYESGI